MPPHQRTTLLDDGSPGSDAWIPKTPWHELRTVIGREGPVEAPINSLRDPRTPWTARFRYAQHLTHGCEDVELRTKLLLAQARNLERTASYEDDEDDDDDDDELDALLSVLWRAGALTKTNRGLLALDAYAAWATALHYALLPNLLASTEALESARGDWERDVSRSGAFEGGRDHIPQTEDPVGLQLQRFDDESSLSSVGSVQRDNSEDSYAPPPSPSRFEEEPGIDQAAFATGMREVLRVWAPDDQAPLLYSLIQAIFGGLDDVCMANHAPYALDTFRRPSDIPCLALLPLSYARERCGEWLKRFDNGAILARRAQKEFEASQANPDQPPRHLLRPTGPSVELSKVPNREKRSTVVSKQLARHFYLPKATRDCGSDARRFLLTLRQKQSAIEKDFLRRRSERHRTEQPSPLCKYLPPREVLTPWAPDNFNPVGTKMRAKKRDPLRSGLFAPGPRSVGGGHTVKMAKASPKPPEYSILTAPHIHRATDISLRGPPTEKKLSQRQLLKRAERRARQRLRQAVDARSIGLLVQYGEARGARGGSTQADSFVAPDDEWPSTTVTTLQLDSQVETHLSAEAQYAQGVLDGRVVVAADAGAATYGMQRPSDDPADDRIRAELAEAKRKAALRLPRAPLEERDALLRKRVPPDVDLLVRARNKILEGAPVLLRYAV
ncbi:unnamed protein product [Pelagomonas calceolata]|uniref:Uncharacterized protein n=1 Tax=Pelagomonas calceolata TaxID=35677 RepID=A0A8J2S9N1_9STRA|nr:unnamed protein product [Pelagomonas calceolata]|mmetsp:Transcript_2857/g.8314  ORF Transcript_2857/g.8314 Transcript_2857/m.8314 type:complete len:670 (+) Transcript_2857:125-2134(+)